MNEEMLYVINQNTAAMHEHADALNRHSAIIAEQNEITKHQIRVYGELKEEIEQFERSLKRIVRNPQNEEANISWIIRRLESINKSFDESARKIGKAAEQLSRR